MTSVDNHALAGIDRNLPSKMQNLHRMVDILIETIDKTMTACFSDSLACSPIPKYFLSSVSKARKITETAVLHQLCPLSANGN